jgi:hypothetical protein
MKTIKTKNEPRKHKKMTNGKAQMPDEYQSLEKENVNHENTEREKHEKINLPIRVLEGCPADHRSPFTDFLCTSWIEEEASPALLPPRQDP